MEENEDSSQNKPVQSSKSSQISDSESELEQIPKDSKEIEKIDISIKDFEILPENTNKCDLSFKVIVIGDSFVGKSSLANKAIKNKFDTTYSTTVGFDYFSFFLKINDKILKLQIWDTCGQENYQSLISNFYRNSSLALMVYAINNRSSFEHIDNWLKEIKVNSNPDAKIFLIGNKKDLEEERFVSYEEAEKYAEDFEFSKFFESSAKNGTNAQEIFIESAKILYEDYLEYKSAISFNTSKVSTYSGQKLINNIDSSKNAREDKSGDCC